MKPIALTKQQIDTIKSMFSVEKDSEIMCVFSMFYNRYVVEVFSGDMWYPVAFYDKNNFVAI